jgi:hypothetical protein
MWLRLIILMVGMQLAAVGTLRGQVKFEREVRIKQEEVPIAALDFVATCAFPQKVKWYLEESFSGTSVEAKTKADGVRYSIEFDTLGRLEDVEREVDWATIPFSVRTEMEKFLATEYSKFRIRKVQEQWTGPEAIISALVRGEDPSQYYITRYEVVLKGKTESEVAWYEYLFSEDGAFLERSRIVFRNTDNLDF